MNVEEFQKFLTVMIQKTLECRKTVRAEMQKSTKKDELKKKPNKTVEKKADKKVISEKEDGSKFDTFQENMEKFFKTLTAEVSDLQSKVKKISEGKSVQKGTTDTEEGKEGEENLFKGLFS